MSSESPLLVSLLIIPCSGDAIAIAKETCKMLALVTKVYNSRKLMHGGLSGTMQHDLVERADGFAEVFPEHKYQVVEMLEQRGHLTAMTGDGRFQIIVKKHANLFRCKRCPILEKSRLRYCCRGCIRSSASCSRYCLPRTWFKYHCPSHQDCSPNISTNEGVHTVSDRPLFTFGDLLGNLDDHSQRNHSRSASRLSRSLCGPGDCGNCL